ncbi:carbohydrate ABC transporter permease [Oscillochloris sp. ZM17-4]|uniref:carbohydrate ABC transporter permease n=1 Tax=Oscillochloris sp. ZM17-4 TaxID=2866714 RepID=UPI0021064494|nr:sugar ABC transporter permease [Oscillochloris sp. ZM17-4]
MTSVSPRTAGGSRRERREWLLFAALIGPNLALFAIFTYWPLLYNLYLSFVRWNFLRPRKPFVWLDNYIEVFTDTQFWIIALNTLTFTVCSVGLTLLIGLALALLINQPLRYRNAARAVLFSPVIMSGAVVAVVWSYIFDPRYGLLDQILGFVGASSPDWLGDPRWAMPAVILVYVWKNVGYAVVIYLAGLQGIPRELYDAARVDGAGAVDRFWHVTLPGLSPVAFFLSVTSLLACFQSFDIVKVLTDGGPAIATTTLIYHLYDLGFVSYDAGKAGVMAMVLFGVMLALTVIQLRYVEERVAYA